MVQQSRYPGVSRPTSGGEPGLPEPMREPGEMALPLGRMEDAEGHEVRRPSNGRAGQVLVVDDDGDARELLSLLLRDAGFDVEQAPDGPAALQIMERHVPALVLADLRMPGLDGLQLLEVARKRGFAGGFVVLTAHASVETAVEAMRRGADDFLRKPIHPESAVKLVQRVLGVQRGPTETALKSDGDPLAGIVGQTPSWTQLLEVVRRAAPTPATVLILGESGTGKELIARAVHQLSPRRAAPLVAVNCAALPESLVEAELFGFERGAFTGATMRRAGRFERAQGGTLFLDEIGELALSAQAKLLQLLQARTFYPLGSARLLRADLRVLAATNTNLETAVAEGRFRQDLFYRLSVLPIRMPTLAERREDIEDLARYFCNAATERHRLPRVDLSPQLVEALVVAEWPGNVRQLGHAIEAAAIRASGSGRQRIERAHLFPDKPAPAAAPPERASAAVAGATFQEATRRFQAQLVRETLEDTGWNIVEASRRLEIARSHLYTLIRALGIERSKP